MNAIMQNFDKIFNASLIYATFRSATPIIFAALCAAITQQANILNIGTEGIMLVGAFTAVAVSYFTGSWLLGIIAAMIAGAVEDRIYHEFCERQRQQVDTHTDRTDLRVITDVTDRHDHRNHSTRDHRRDDT